MFGSHDPYANLRQLITTPVGAMKTFQIDQPIETHFRIASCREADCAHYAGGWKMGFDLLDREKAKAARWIRDRSGKAFTFELVGNTVTFTFKAGQECFRKHRVPLEREPFYVVRNGDWRGNPENIRTLHRSADTFIDQWENDLDRINTLKERG